MRTTSDFIEALLIKGVNLTGLEQAWVDRALTERDAEWGRLVVDGKLERDEAARVEIRALREQVRLAREELDAERAWTKALTTTVALARSAALEEAAKLCDDTAEMECSTTAALLADGIRALTGTTPAPEGGRG